jgi:cysteine desulfurase
MALHPAARETLVSALEVGYADPRRLHQEARWSRLMLDNARAVVAQCLGVRPDEVVFTSSGTEAVHKGLIGMIAASEKAPVAVSAIEHSSVFAARRWTQREEVSWPVNSLGGLDLAQTGHILKHSPSVVAIQSANHEVGTRQPIAEVAQALGDVPLFMDACASMGVEKLPEGWSVAAGSAHKWGGPPGVGVLLIRKGAKWRNPFPEDERADHREVGFANVPSILAAAAALQAWTEERAEFDRTRRAWIDRLRRDLLKHVPDVDLVGDPYNRLPHVLTFSCLYINGEALVTELDKAGIAVASGSACTASTLAPSHVLAAMGALTHGNVRISLGRMTTTEDVDTFLEKLPHVVTDLRWRL